ncbi:hypothetical protein ACTMU2_38015 [Cupriavidus basilensis]
MRPTVIPARACSPKGHARRGLPVRLLGVGVGTSDRDTSQLELFP